MWLVNGMTINGSFDIMSLPNKGCAPPTRVNVASRHLNREESKKSVKGEGCLLHRVTGGPLWPVTVVTLGLGRTTSLRLSVCGSLLIAIPFSHS